ncbi:MAG TPA: preprotein translocase subunit YajC [Pseudonocardiaceae bacterium]
MESLFLPLLLLILLVPMLLSARRQKRLMQETQQMQNSLTAGDRVMTHSGLYGTVVSTTDTTIDLEVAPGVVTTWLKAAVREKVQEDPDLTETDEVEDTTDEAGTSQADTVVAETEQDGTSARTEQSNTRR